MTTAIETDPAARTGPPPPARRPGRSRWSLSRAGFWLAIALLTVVFVAPLLWMVSTSLKTNPDATRQPPSWIPSPFTTSGYEPLTNLTSQTPVVRWFVNSILAATGNAALIVVTASLAAYALARLDFPGKKFFFGLIVGTLFIPAFLFLVPNYLIIAKFGWLDSLWALILPSAGGAFGVFFLRQVFLSLPRELEEAALLDGANQFQIFTRVVVPLARPALATLIVLSFLTNWNDFLWPVYVLFSPSNFTLPAGLSILQGAYTTNYPVIMAGAVVASVPVIILFIAAQRHVVESVARSGLKG